MESVAPNVACARRRFFRRYACTLPSALWQSSSGFFPTAPAPMFHAPLSILHFPAALLSLPLLLAVRPKAAPPPSCTCKSWTAKSLEFGHAVTIVGYDNPGQFFVVKNSCEPWVCLWHVLAAAWCAAQCLITRWSVLGHTLVKTKNARHPCMPHCSAKLVQPCCKDPT